METETTILNLVTSAKNQQKTQEKIQKLNVSQQQQQNLLSQHLQQHFSCKHNTCQNEPQFEHEILQRNVQKQSSKESNSQNTLKTLYVGNLNKNTTEQHLMSFLICEIQHQSSIIYHLFSKEKRITNKYNKIKLNKTNKTLRNNLAYYVL